MSNNQFVPFVLLLIFNKTPNKIKNLKSYYHFYYHISTVVYTHIHSEWFIKDKPLIVQK